MNTYSPSHASSSVSQVANMYQGNPQALERRTQATNGMTPELIDLLAFQKMQADRKAAANQMALSMGQQPTVAQGMKDEAMTSARDEVTKSMGLPGLMQAAPPQNRQQMAPQTPQPSQQMAGLPSAQSNLPQQYQAGGIVAFDAGGDVDTARGAEAEALKALRGAGGLASRRQNPEAYQGLVDAYEQTKRQRADAEAGYSAAMEGAPESKPFFGGQLAQQTLRTRADAPTGREGVGTPMPRSMREGASPPYTPQAAPTPAADPTVRAPQPRPAPVAQAQQQVQEGAQPVQAPQGDDFTQALRASVKQGLSLNPNAEAAIAQKRFDTEVGQANVARIAEQTQRAEGLKALHAQQAADRPSKLEEWMREFGANVHSRDPHAGVAARMDATKAGQNAQDVKNMEVYNGLRDAADKALRENDIGRYHAFDLEAKSVLERINKAQTSGTSLVNTEEMASTKRQVAKDAAAARVTTANIAAAGRADANANRVTERQDTKAATIARSQEQQAMSLAMRSADKAFADPGNALAHKKQGHTAESLAADMYPRILAQLRGAAPPQAPGMEQGRAGQFKVLR